MSINLTPLDLFSNIVNFIRNIFITIIEEIIYELLIIFINKIILYLSLIIFR